MGNHDLAPALFLVFVVSFVLSAIIWITKRWQLNSIRRRNDTAARQASHSVPTPRLGGVAVMIALAVGSLLIAGIVGAKAVLFLLTLPPLFLGGLLEDLGYGVSPRQRLFAAAISSALVIIFFKVWIVRVGVPGVDTLLAIAPIGIIFTIFAAVGVSNAFNLIDGLNGLSVSTAIMTASSLAYVSNAHGLNEISVMCFVLITALGGFLFFNYPFGKVFLGDAGAYSIGQVLVWLAIAIMFFAPDISPAAILLIFFWPVADTALAIYRRRRSGRRTDQPDRLHFHQLAMRALEISYLGKRRRELANPLATAIIVPLIAMPQLAGIYFNSSNTMAFAMLGGFSILFVLGYFAGVRWARANAGRFYR